MNLRSFKVPSVVTFIALFEAKPNFSSKLQFFLYWVWENLRSDAELHFSAEISRAIDIFVLVYISDKILWLLIISVPYNKNWQEILESYGTIIGELGRSFPLCTFDWRPEKQMRKQIKKFSGLQWNLHKFIINTHICNWRLYTLLLSHLLSSCRPQGICWVCSDGIDCDDPWSCCSVYRTWNKGRYKFQESCFTKPLVIIWNKNNRVWVQYGIVQENSLTIYFKSTTQNKA
jgi:hypothetical protein